MDEGQTPTITVGGANDGPPPHTTTLVFVSGQGFPPGVDVHIHVSSPSLGETRQVNDEGTFELSQTVHRLSDGAVIAATVTYKPDPDSPDIELKGDGPVVGVGGAGAG